MATWLGERHIGDSLVFTEQAQDSSGSAADVAAGPTYAVYEDETAAPIVSGTMTLLGGAGSGLYSEEIAISEANGFEVDKDYTIRVTATIDGQMPATILRFRVVSPVETDFTAQPG